MGILKNISIASAILSCFPKNNNDESTRNTPPAPPKNPDNTAEPDNSSSSAKVCTQDISYILPSNYGELDRTHQRHWVLKLKMKGNYQAPISKWLKSGITVLDSGCGPATWTLEMAESYQNSKFIGVDAFPIFPQDIKPPNSNFEIANIGKKMPFEDNTFDYIHQRLVFFGLSCSDWETNLAELYRIAKPGAYVELIEPDLYGYLNMGPWNIKIRDQVAHVLELRQMKPRAGYELQGLLEKAGFKNVVTKQAQFNINHTDKCGELFWYDYVEGWNGLRPVMVKIDPSYEDPVVYNQALEGAGNDARDHKMMALWYYCYAQKPFETN